MASKCKAAEIKDVVQIGDPWFVSLVLYESNYRMAYRTAIEYPETLKCPVSEPNILPVYFRDLETAQSVMKFLITHIIKTLENSRR